MATNLTIDESVTTVNISGVTETAPAYTTITLSNDQGAQGPTGATGPTSTTPGPTGNGISSIVRTSGTGAAGTTDTFTITYTNSTTTTFQVYNGSNGNNGTDGRSINSISKTSTAGLVDTYTITYSTGSPSTFTVTNGNTGATGQGYAAQGTWSGSTAYVPYDVVYWAGNSWRCKTANTGNSPVAGTYWELLTLGFNAQGTYSSSTTYNQGDVVSHQGGSYYCYSDGTVGRTPTNTTYWAVIANKGDTGPTGLTGPVYPSFVSQGYYRTPLQYSATATAQNINTIFFTPFYVSASTTFDQIGVIASTVAASPTCTVRLGIYNDSNGVPGTLSLDAGTATQTTISGTPTSIPITISKTLTPGWYWLAAKQETGSAANTFICTAASSTVSGLQRMATPPLAYVANAFTQAGLSPGAFPSTATPSLNGGAVMITWIRAQ